MTTGVITCPWCGTNYLEFRSNCKNCSGPLPPPRAAHAPAHQAARSDTPLSEAPPPAPRPISDSFALRLLTSDGWAVASFVVVLVGGIFFCVGGPLTIGIATAMVGIPFMLLGLALLGAAGAVVAWRYQIALQTVRVLRDGEAATGQIAGTRQNFNVEVNGRNPWVITYQFRTAGRDYNGQVTTLNEPGPSVRPGSPAWVLYLPNTPEHSALYPHP
jgi:hypothetical protein